jgi:hypothetical protein
MALFNPVLKELFALSLIVLHRVEPVGAGTYVKQNNTEFTGIYFFSR